MRVKQLLSITALFTGIIACAGVSNYVINIKYVPQRAVLQNSKTRSKPLITIARFNDISSLDNKTVTGSKSNSNDDTIRALATAEDPARDVSAAFRTFLIKAGYDVDSVMPEWDLRDSSIDSAWNKLVIGGSIDELEVFCRKAGAGVQYNSVVKLRVVFADAQRKKILHTTTLESSASLKHLVCSEEMMQKQINDTLSMAIEKIAENDELNKVVAEISSVRAESLTD
jgi:hypothetical protein